MEEELKRVEDLIETGRLEKALEILKGLPEEDNTVGALYLRGYVYYCAGDHEHAIEDFTRVVEQDKSHADAWYYLALMAITNNEHARAKECIERAMDRDPENEDYIGCYAGIEQTLGNFDHVIELCSKILADTPGSYFALNAKGLAHLYKGDLEDAVSCFSEATLENPLDFLSWNNLGLAYTKLNQIEEAGKALQKSLSLNPSFSDAYGHMAYLIFQKGNVEKAFEFVDYAIELDPKNADAYKTRARVNLSLGEKEKAKEDLLLAKEFGYNDFFITGVNELLNGLA